MKFLSAERLVVLASAIVASQLAIGVAMGADVAAPMPTKAWPTKTAPVSGWTFSATPYGWVTLMNGSTTVKGRTVDVDVGFNDLMDLIGQSEIPKDLMAFMGYFEARNGRVSLFADVVYMKIGLDAEHGAIARRRRTQRDGRGIRRFEI